MLVTVTFCLDCINDRYSNIFEHRFSQMHTPYVVTRLLLASDWESDYLFSLSFLNMDIFGLNTLQNKKIQLNLKNL